MLTVNDHANVKNRLIPSQDYTNTNLCPRFAPVLGALTWAPSAPSDQILHWLFAAHGQSIDPNRRRRHAPPEFQIAPNLRDIVEYLFQIAGDRDFFHWKRELAVHDPHARGSAGVIAGH